MLEALAQVPEEKRADLARRKARSLKLSQHDIDNLLGILRLPDLAPFLGDDARSEVEISLKIGGKTVMGRLDRMAVTPDTIWLLDYKTTSRPPKSLVASDTAVQQLSLYAQSLQLAYPGRAIKVALLYTTTAQLYWLDPSLMSQSCELSLNRAA
jgi:ATP-dependent helicase/nuclease subunit A